MGMHPHDPMACGMFLLGAFVVAGVVQTMWLASPLSRALAVPLDGGLTWRGVRLFGANKTARGFVAFVPASAGSFASLATLMNPAHAGLWPLSVAQYAGLGAIAGFGFMAGELPNSFVKRQLAIRPGEIAERPWAAMLQFTADRLDSGVGMLTAVSLVVPTPWTTWMVVLLAGSTLHWGFSAALCRLGVKRRHA